MRLNEFLEQHLPPYMLIKYIKKLYNIELVTNEYDLGWSTYSFKISRANLLTDLKIQNISIKNFEAIISKYGWYISNISGNNITLNVENNIDNKFYRINDNAIFKNYYLHITASKPSLITNHGLIAKNSTDPNVEKNLTMQRDILYPNNRVYLWDLEEITGYAALNDKNFDKKILSGFNSILNGLHAKTYGNYAYLIELPSSIKLHYDNEYGTDNPARYITQNIPPSYIKYIGTISRISSILKDNDWKRLRQIINII